MTQPANPGSRPTVDRDYQHLHERVVRVAAVVYGGAMVSGEGAVR